MNFKTLCWVKAARTERPYYIIHLYEFLEQTNLIYNSVKQIRPAGGDRKWTSKGHEETVRVMEMLCVVYVLLAVSIGRSTQMLFLHQERESPFPRFCYRQWEPVRNFLPYTFGGRGGTQTFSLLQVLRKAVLPDGEEPEQESRILDLEPAQPITSHMTFLCLTFLTCKIGVIIPANIELF